MGKRKKGGKGNKYLTVGLFMTGLAVFLGILGLFWTPYSTTAMSAAEKFAAPSLAHWFGTDNFGRDIFSRVMQGCSTTLAISLLVVLFSASVGILLGAVTGYFGGILDEVVMRVTDAVNRFSQYSADPCDYQSSGNGKAECDYCSGDCLYSQLCADCAGRVYPAAGCGLYPAGKVDGCFQNENFICAYSARIFSLFSGFRLLSD